MTETQAPPAHRTLASELRWVRANLPDDTAQSVTRALDAAVERAETEATQARIWHGEAKQRETAEALIERLRAELERLGHLLPEPVEGDEYARGLRFALTEITRALTGEH